MPDDTVEESARFKELQAEAEDLGWELIDKDEYHTWGYVLRPIGQDPDKVNLCTNSAVRLDPEDPDNPLTGLDSVSHMLNQIRVAQGWENG
jgi:hypothetical protein